ncbi:MAG: DUF5658 family protein, partial [Candidatus Aminicenantales bacterium]
MRKTAIFATIVLFAAGFAGAGVIKNEADPSIADITIMETALLPIAVSPLAALDLLPDPAPKASYAAMNLSPNQVVMDPGHRYLNRGIRAGNFADAAFNVNLIAMIALNVGDYLSTTQAMKYPGLAEGNPLMKPFVKSPIAFAGVKLGITAATYFGFKALYKTSKPMAWLASTAANFFLGYCVSNNYRL